MEKAGAWYPIKGNDWARAEAVRDFLKTNPAIAKEIEGKVRELCRACHCGGRQEG